MERLITVLSGMSSNDTTPVKDVKPERCSGPCTKKLFAGDE